MARLAALHLELVTRIEFEDLGMDRVRPVRVFLRMASDARLLADIARLRRARRRLKLSYALQERQTRVGANLQIVSDLMSEADIRDAATVDVIMNCPHIRGETGGMITSGRQSLRGRHKTAKQKRRNAATPNE